jgi:thioredoxin 1
MTGGAKQGAARGTLPPEAIIVAQEPYGNTELTREEVDSWTGPVLLQFGTNWCGHCQAAEPAIEAATAGIPELRRVKVEDGPGRPLGRSFRVKLWPTLIFLRDGTEVARLVRPEESPPIREQLERLVAG